MSLSKLAILLGLGFALPNVYGLMKPAAFRDVVRRFPRSEICGWILMLLGTAWFLYYLKQESIADFARFKPAMMAGFAAVGIGTCLYVKDFLAVRGLAVVLMLLAKFVLDTQRWHPSEWRWVLAVWAYLWILVGMWFTISPWRLRDLLEWGTKTDQRVRVSSGVRLAFGLFVAILGLTAFRAS